MSEQRLTFLEGLRRARSHLVFIFALLTGTAIVLSLDGLDRPARYGTILASEAGRSLQLTQREPSPSSAEEKEWARIAWSYFERNIDPTTGLANSTDRFPSTTMWDTGSFLLGMIAAERLGVIDRTDFDRRMAKALASLAALPLFGDTLPNKAYDTRTLAVVDYNNQPSAEGLGWSALDVARLIVPLTYLTWTYPEQAAAAQKVLQRWKLRELAQGGELIGTQVTDGRRAVHQEGRLGYEQYAAKAAILAGLDAFRAFDDSDNSSAITVEGSQLPADTRPGPPHGPARLVTSEPYILDGLEFGFDVRSRGFAEQVYLAQQRRFERTKIVTAVSEGHLDRPPFFAYATVWAEGADWAVLTNDGKRIDDARTFNTKAAFAWSALFAGSYSDRLQSEAAKLRAENGAFLEGRYEASSAVNAAETANTNGIVLQALAYRAFGPLLRR